MKASTLFSITSVIVLCLSCSQPSVVSRQPETSEPAPSAVAPPDALPRLFAIPPNMEGMIAGKYEIRMSVSQNGDSLSGSYIYTKHNVPISLAGTIDKSGNVILDESADGNPTGRFEGKMISAGEMSGLWSQPNGEKPTPFVLKAVGADLHAATPQTVPLTTSLSNTITSAPSTSSSLIKPPTSSQVEAAINKLVSNLRLGGSIEVEGVRESPQQNTAIADLRFREFKYGRNFERQPITVSQYEKGAGSKTGSYWADTYNETMKPQATIYSGSGTAILTHYTDGRWVLKAVQWSNGFLGWKGNIEIK